jgi:hypothetical protein
MPANPRVEKTLCPRGVRNHNRKPLDLVGQKFDRLLVVELFGIVKHGTVFACRCDCGNDLLVRSYALRLGRTKSCGCLRPNQFTNRSTNHIATVPNPAQQQPPSSTIIN